MPAVHQGIWYQRLMRWASHPHAAAFLAFVSFIESIIFPIPVDMMLIPMGVAKPYRVFHYAVIATLASVLGGIVGYYIGLLAMDTVGQFILEAIHFENSWTELMTWFESHGVWVVVLAAVTPIPFKVITLASGALHMPLLPFCVAALLGRTIRYGAVACLVRLLHRQIDLMMVTVMDRLGWAALIATLLGLFAWKFW